MKKYIIILFIIIGLLSIFYYENRTFINQNKFNNTGIDQYNKELYTFSIGPFMLANNLNENSIPLYNIGNSHYKTAEEKTDESEKVAYYELALDSYSGSLNIEYNQDTKDNYEYVKEKLDKLLNPEQEEDDNKSEEESNENQEGEEENSESNQEGEKQESNESNAESTEEQEGSETEDSHEGTKGEEKNGEENSSGNDGTNGKEGNGEGEGTNQDEKLSQEQLNQIEKYSEDLKKSEFYNQKYFNKVSPDELKDKSYDELLDIFERGGEKDW